MRIEDFNNQPDTTNGALNKKFLCQQPCFWVNSKFKKFCKEI